MFFHASPIVDLKVLEPNVSNHHIPLIISLIKENMF